MWSATQRWHGDSLPCNPHWVCNWPYTMDYVCSEIRIGYWLHHFCHQDPYIDTCGWQAGLQQFQMTQEWYRSDAVYILYWKTQMLRFFCVVIHANSWIGLWSGRLSLVSTLINTYYSTALTYLHQGMSKKNMPVYPWKHWNNNCLSD